MDSMYGSWMNSFPLLESLNNHDLAIRRFCPARVEQEQREGGETLLDDNEEVTTIFNYDFDQQSLLYWGSPIPSDNITSTPHDLAVSEEEEFVESFFNMDCYELNKELPEEQDHHNLMPIYDSFQGDDDKYSNVMDDVYEDVSSMIEGNGLEINGLVNDFGAVSEMVHHSSVQDQVSHGVNQGLHLVHLLLACAEAVGCHDTQLADSMLNQVLASASPWGDSLQRVSYCFAMGLKSRLSLLLHNVNPNGTFTNGTTMHVSLTTTKKEKLEAFQLLYQTTPYIAFGFMAANEAICEAAQGKDSIHIISLGMEHALQWPSLIRTLASRRQGPPKLVRITGLIKHDNHDNFDLELEANMKSVIEYASSLGIPVEFNVVSEPLTASLLTKETLDIREDGALFVNSIMHLHKYVKESRGSLKAVLQAIKKLCPTLLTVVEQDSNHNGPFFLGRFLESLHYYSAIFDSLEASLPRTSPQRMKIERDHFEEEIRNIVAYEGTVRVERHERADQWRRTLGRAGFQVMGLKCMSQARKMLSVYGCDGYTLANEKGYLLLGWKGRPIMLASAWQVHS